MFVSRIQDSPTKYSCFGEHYSTCFLDFFLHIFQMDVFHVNELELCHSVGFDSDKFTLGFAPRRLLFIFVHSRSRSLHSIFGRVLASLVCNNLGIGQKTDPSQFCQSVCGTIKRAPTHPGFGCCLIARKKGEENKEC